MKKVLFLAVLLALGLWVGAAARRWFARAPAPAASPAAAPARSGFTGSLNDAAGILKTMLADLDLEAARQYVVRRARELLKPGTSTPTLAPAPGIRRQPDARPAPLPEVPGESHDQKAARLWQGGVLAMRQGDYQWAVRLFEDCLQVQPRNGDCADGVAEAKRRRSWNRKPGRP